MKTKMRTKKKLGQHFLQDKKLAQEFVKSLNIKKGNFIIEIGPGKGIITKEIIKKKKNTKIILIEKDAILSKKLEKLKEKYKNVEIITGDALKILPQLSAELSENYKIVGNIPFYITGRLLRVLSELKNKPSVAVLGIQKEVAKRISARPSKMNLLAAAVQIWANPETIKIIPKKYFHPRPKVDGAIMRLSIKEEKVPAGYYETIKTVFKHPRKTILNNILASGVEKNRALKILKTAGLNSKTRPQNLSISTIKKIALMLYNK